MRNLRHFGIDNLEKRIKNAINWHFKFPLYHLAIKSHPEGLNPEVACDMAIRARAFVDLVLLIVYRFLKYLKKVRTSFEIFRDGWRLQNG